MLTILRQIILKVTQGGCPQAKKPDRDGVTGKFVLTGFDQV